MKKIFTLLASMSLLVGCVESVAVMGGGAANGKIVQSSLQSGFSYGIKKQTGKTPIGHAVNYIKEKKMPIEQGSCSSFTGKKDHEICIMLEKRISTKQNELKEKVSFNNSSKEFTSSLQSSIDAQSKIKYLD